MSQASRGDASRLAENGNTLGRGYPRHDSTAISMQQLRGIHLPQGYTFPRVILNAQLRVNVSTEFTRASNPLRLARIASNRA